MAIEAKDILNYLGIDGEINSIEDFKSKHNTKFMTLETAKQNDELVNSIVGHRIGELETKLWKGVKELGIDVDKKQFEGKRVNEYAEDLFGRIKESYGSKIEELESKASNAGNSEREAELEKELGKYQKKYTDLQELHEGFKNESQTKLSDYETKLKTYKVNHQLKSVMDNLKLKEMDPFQKKGFMAEINERFKFDVNDNDELEVYDRKTDKPIQSKEKAGAFAKPFDALKDFAVENEFWQKNPHEKRQNGSMFINREQKPPEGSEKKLRSIPAHVAQRAGY